MILSYKLYQRVDVRFINAIGIVSYEFYLLHGYYLGKWGTNIFGATIFIIVSFTTAFIYWLIWNKVKKLVNVRTSV